MKGTSRLHQNTSRYTSNTSRLHQKMYFFREICKGIRKILGRVRVLTFGIGKYCNWEFLKVCIYSFVFDVALMCLMVFDVLMFV